MEKRWCSSCGKKEMVRDIRDQVMPYKGDSITVTSLPGWYCVECGESEFIDSADAERFAAEVEVGMRRIDESQPVKIRAMRKKLGLKQVEASALFGGGVNAFSEYERGIRQPAKSTVILMKILEHHPELLDEVKAVA